MRFRQKVRRFALTPAGRAVVVLADFAISGDSFTGDDGNQVTVAAVASARTATMPNALVMCMPRMGMRARTAVTTTRFTRPLMLDARSGFVSAASAAPPTDADPPAPIPPTMIAAHAIVVDGAMAATPNAAAIAIRLTRPRRWRCRPEAIRVVARQVTAQTSSDAVRTAPAADSVTPRSSTIATIIRGMRFAVMNPMTPILKTAIPRLAVSGTRSDCVFVEALIGTRATPCPEGGG